MNYVTTQGINGPVFALIAFDTVGYDIPKLPDGSDGVQTTREGLVEYILDGSFLAVVGHFLVVMLTRI